jgi:hypothetical protein
VLTGAVARAVIRGALAALPASLPLRQRLLSVLASFNFPGAAQLAGAVYTSLETDFAAHEAAWELRARRHWPGGPSSAAPSLPPDPLHPAAEAGGSSAAAAALAGHEDCCQVYEAAVAALPASPAMWGYYTGTLRVLGVLGVLWAGQQPALLLKLISNR